MKCEKSIKIPTMYVRTACCTVGKEASQKIAAGSTL